MSASSIYFNGVFTRIPGSYSRVDASGLDAVGLGASGIVACVGTAIGGKPYTAVDPDDVAGTLQASTRPGKAQEYFQEGSRLLKAEQLLFNPSKDDDITAGAQKVFWVKVNPSEASDATFSNTDGAALVLTSQDWGYKTTQIGAQIADGTTEGKMYTITYQDTEEVYDDVLLSIFTLQYLATTPANGFATITIAVSATALTAAFTRTQLGKDTDITNPVTADTKCELVSSDTGDHQVVTLYGINGSGAVAKDTITLNGTTVVESNITWDLICGGMVASVPTGTVTVRNLGVGTTIFTLTSGAMTKGIGECSDMPIANTTVTLVADAATTKKAIIVGTSTAGSEQLEAVTLNGTTPVVTTSTWSGHTRYVMGNVEVARTVTISGTAVSATFASYPTLAACIAWFNSRDGFTMASTQGNLEFAMINMDVSAAVDCKSPANPIGYANLYQAITVINQGSGLVTATRGTPGTGAPDNTTTTIYLTGGHEGDDANPATPTADAADWQAAINLLKKIYVNSIVPLTADPSVHAVVDAHIAYMCGAGRMERDGAVGLMNAGMTAVPSKTEIKSQIIVLNSRHLRAIAQQCERYDSSGTREKLDPYYTACLAIGMQAGSEVGTSLTHKYVNTLGAYGSNTWSTQDDADEMIELGLLFLERVDGVGFRWVRNVTTKISSSNIVYTEAEVNEAANYSVYNFRTEMEWAVGRKGFAGTVQAAEGVARNVLTLLTGVSLTSWRSLAIELMVQVLEVSVEMAPVFSIVFVENTIHLVASTISASS